MRSPRAQALPGHALPGRVCLASLSDAKQSLAGSACPGRAWARGLLTRPSPLLIQQRTHLVGQNRGQERFGQECRRGVSGLGELGIDDVMDKMHNLRARV